MSVLFNQAKPDRDGSRAQGNIYKKECLWVLSNLLGESSQENFEILLENKALVDRVCEIASSKEVDSSVKKEALVVIYNMCENHGNKYLNKVMLRNPQ